MTTRIITADEAKSMLASATPGPWMRDGLYVRNDPHDVALARALDDEGNGCGESFAPHNANLLAAAPDLAATVVAQATEYLALAKRMDDRGFELRAAKVEAHTARHLLATLADAVRRERDARAEWLDSLPDGSCGNQPPAALLNAETATGEALRAIEEPR